MSTKNSPDQLAKECAIRDMVAANLNVSFLAYCFKFTMRPYLNTTRGDNLRHRKEL